MLRVENHFCSSRTLQPEAQHICQAEFYQVHSLVLTHWTAIFLAPPLNSTSPTAPSQHPLQTLPKELQTPVQVVDAHPSITLPLHWNYMNFNYFTNYKVFKDLHPDWFSILLRRMGNLVKDLNLNLSKLLAVGTPQSLPWTNLFELDLVGIGKGKRS